MEIEKKTRHSGVYRLTGNRYRIRAKYMDPRKGKPAEIDRVVTAPSASAAAQARADLLDEARAGATPQRLRLSEYGASWLARKKMSLAPSTLDRYGRALVLHVFPLLGDLYLDAVQAADVVRWRDKLATHRRPENAPRNWTRQPSSINSALRVLKTMLADAAGELRLHDPSARVAQVSEARALDADGKAATADELAAVLDEMRTEAPDAHACAMTLGYTALRWGEVSALRKDAVDLDALEIAVERARWLRHDGAPKTGTRRTVPIVPELAEVLREQMKRSTSDLVFPGSRGARFRSRTWLADKLHAAAERALGRKFTPHQFRHTWSDLLRRVSERDVQKSITGHSTEKMRTHYSHIDAGEKADAAGRALRLVRGKTG